MVLEKNIPVLDTNNVFLSYTNPAKARILIKKGKAYAFNLDPFIIKMKGEGEIQMSQGMIGNSVTNFTKYFSEEREVYVQNLGSTQISLSFTSGVGDTVHVVIPKSRKPLNLTQMAPFESIKKSMDFRKIINRRPPVLRLMDESEYLAYYENLAKQNRTTVEEELNFSLEHQYNLMNKPVISSEVLKREMEQKFEDKIEELEKPAELHPKIVGLCAMADKEQGESRLSANDFMEDLEALSSELTLDDWEFISTKGVYKVVKNYAAKKLDLATSDSESDE